RVLAARVVATPDVSALGTASEMHPLPAEFEAFHTTRAARRHGANVIEMRAGVSHGPSLANSSTPSGRQRDLWVTRGTSVRDPTGANSAPSTMSTRFCTHTPL